MMSNLIFLIMSRNFNANQNRHLFVATAYGDVSDSASTGTITLKTTAGGGNTGKAMYFLYKGPDTVLRSNLIQIKNLDYVKAIAAKDLRTPFKSQLITLDTDVNGGNLVSGQDYVLRIVLRQWIGMSDKDIYYKEGVVHATSSMTAETFYNKMVESLNLSFSKEIGATKTSNPYLKFTASATGITITEKAQDWKLGLERQLPVLFDAEPTTVFVDGEDVKWGKVTSQTAAVSKVTIDGDTPTGRGNGHDIADLEYFALGERGDQYRMVGFPNVIFTKYLVDSNSEYNVLEIHHAFTDTGINSYESDKDLTIVSTDASVINSIVTAINTATGKTFDTLDTGA